MQDLPAKLTPDPGGTTDEGKASSTHHFQKMVEEGILPHSFYKANNTISKPDKYG
jgi:hypothetical protein